MGEDVVEFRVVITRKALEKAKKFLSDQEGIDDGMSDTLAIQEAFLIQSCYSERDVSDECDIRNEVQVEKIK